MFKSLSNKEGLFSKNIGSTENCKIEAATDLSQTIRGRSYGA